MDQNTTLLLVGFAIAALVVGMFIGKVIFDEIAHTRKMKKLTAQRQNNNPAKK